MTLAFVVRLETHHVKEQAERGRHDLQNGALTLGLVIGPVGSLAVLTTVLSKLAATAGAQRDIGDEAVGVAGVFTFNRPWIVHFEAPGAILAHTEHVNHCDDRVALENRLAHLSALDGSRCH